MLTRVDVHIQVGQSGLPIDRDFQLLRLHGHRPVRLRSRPLGTSAPCVANAAGKGMALLPQSLQPLHGGLACRTVMPHGRQLTQRVKKLGASISTHRAWPQTQRLAQAPKGRLPSR